MSDLLRGPHLDNLSLIKHGDSICNFIGALHIRRMAMEVTFNFPLI
jgi:hypothetical protein